MPVIQLTCPTCSFSREYESSKIPPQMRSATCPRCGAKVPLPEETTAFPASAATPATPPAAVDAVAPAAATAFTSPAGPGAELPRTAAPQTSQQRKLHFRFHGNGRDYFGIWIVNTMLKIVTCGIYSAWAKVRQRRYFYGNTTLNGIPFDYLGDPLALFKGWLIAAVCFVLYSVASRIDPGIAGLLSLVFFLGMPWLIVRSRTFNLRNSAHRNIRFTFTPKYGQAYLVFVGLPLLLPFTLGLITPYMVYRQKKFLVENSGYGRTRYTFDARPGEFYLVFLKAGLWFVAAAALLVGGCLLLGPGLDTLKAFALHKHVDQPPMTLFLMFLPLLFIPVLYLFTSMYLRTALTNLTWNSTSIKHSRFSSTLKVGAMAWLYLSSAAAIILSLGLLIPWTTVRLARYRFENLAIELKDDQDGFLGWGHANVSSTGEEIGDLFGIDIGL